MIYLYYNETATIDYIFLLALYKIAKSNKADKLKNIIHYKSVKELSKMLESVGCYRSTATINRILKDRIQQYNDYLIYNKTDRVIILRNDFRQIDSKRNKFITIRRQNIDILLKYDNNLLCKYYFYIVYYCGKSKSNTTDFTAKQFLHSSGYSMNSKNYISKLSEFNNILLSNGLIKVYKYKDNNGHERNRYII